MGQLPFELRREFAKGNLVLFVGSGFVRNYLPAMPTWNTLLRSVFQSLTGDPKEIFRYCEPVFDAEGNRLIPSGEYLKLAQKFELAREHTNKSSSGTSSMHAVPSIHRQIATLLHNRYSHKALSGLQNTYYLQCRDADLPLNAWITTNYDTFLEDTYFLPSSEVTVLARPVQSADFRGNFVDAKLLLKIHGCLTKETPEDSIVITEEDYYRFLRQDRYMINKLYTLFCERTVVFLGYSLSDPNIQFIYHDFLFDHQSRSADDKGVSSRFSNIRLAFFVSNKKPPDDQRIYFRQKRIMYVECEIEQFFKELLETHTTNLQHRKDIRSRINENADLYNALYSSIDWNVNPTTFSTEITERLALLTRLLDLVEFYENAILAAGQFGAAIEPFEHNRLVGTVHGFFKLADVWCNEALSQDQTDVLELVIGFAGRIPVSDSWMFHEMLRTVNRWLRSFVRRELKIFIHTFCDLLFNYDGAFHKWDDYTFLLEEYVLTTPLFPVMEEHYKKRVANGLYRQLMLCGRSVGDSWYTTEKVYSVWPQFNSDAWQYLKAEVEKHAMKGDDNEVLYSNKDQAILHHLAPGADFKQFHPRR